MQTASQVATVLVAEDEPEVRDYLETALRCQGYRVECAQDGEEVLACLHDTGRDISLVLLDIMMPRKDGLETLREIRRLDHEMPIIMLSGASSPLNIVEAIKNGATDFLGKPVSHGELGEAIRKALQVRAAGAGQAVEESPAAAEAFLAGSVHMKRVERAIEQIGASDVPVLLQGESGVGKEVLARQLHGQSPRASKPFLKINCAALPSELLESELFGYERGAFTGAFKSKPGKFELADGGTILLDEIGDMDFKLQAKLLQVLQDHEYQRLGGKETVTVDVRVLAATHCDLERAMREGQFREDLYYRLNVINIQVPALRERRDEILPLTHYFLKKHGAPGVPPPETTPGLRQALLAHDWPGNIRELENVARKFLVFRDAEMLEEELRFKTRRKLAEQSTAGAPQAGPVLREPPEVPPEDGAGPVGVETRPPEAMGVVVVDAGSAAPEARGEAPRAEPAGFGNPPVPKSTASVLAMVDEARRRAQAEAILGVLNATHWNRKQAAAILRLDYKALLYKMKKLSIEDQPAPAIPLRPGTIESEPLSEPSILDNVERARQQAEAQAILSVLESTRWNRKHAAQLLKIDYKALLYKMKKLSIGQKAPEGAADGRP